MLIISTLSLYNYSVFSYNFAILLQTLLTLAFVAHIAREFKKKIESLVSYHEPTPFSLAPIFILKSMFNVSNLEFLKLPAFYTIFN